MLGKTRKSQLTFGEHSDDHNNVDEPYLKKIQPPIVKKEQQSSSSGQKLLKNSSGGQEVKNKNKDHQIPDREVRDLRMARLRRSMTSGFNFIVQINVRRHRKSEESSRNQEQSGSGGCSVNKASSGSNKIGSLTSSKNTKSNTQSEPCPICISRVTASSKVNFTKLNDEEKELRFRNMSREIKHLRRKLRALDGRALQTGETPQDYMGDEKPEQIYLQAEDFMLEKRKKFEIEDSSNVLRQLAELIVEKKEVIKSLEFNLICSIVRKLRSLNPAKQVTLTIAEVNFFSSNTKEGIINTLIGGTKRPSIQQTPPVQQFQTRPIKPEFKLPPLRQPVMATGMPVFQPGVASTSPQGSIMQPVNYLSGNAAMPSGCVIYMPQPQMMLNQANRQNFSDSKERNYARKPIRGAECRNVATVQLRNTMQVQVTKAIDGCQNKEGYIIEKR